jgi:hypothetical protein
MPIEIKEKNEKRPAAYDPMETMKKREAQKEAQKQKTEEKAAEKAEMDKYLNRKRQERFREQEHAKKARTAKDEKDDMENKDDDDHLGYTVASLPIAIRKQGQTGMTLIIEMILLWHYRKLSLI